MRATLQATSDSALVLFAFARFRNGQRAADFPDEQIGDFVVAGDRFAATRGGIPVDGMRAAFAFERAAVRFEVADEFAPFQASSSTRTSPATTVCHNEVM